MKKGFFCVAVVAMILAASCNKGDINNNEIKTTPVVLTATAENTTKATINTSDQVLWQSGDIIGVRVYKGTAYKGTDSGSKFTASDWSFTLSSGENTSTGVFSNNGLDEYHHWSYAAFYPVYDNNVGGDGQVYFHFQDSYDYESGRSVTPLVANMNTNNRLDERPTTIAFKQVAGTILVTINNVPKLVNKFSLSLENQNITGWGNVDPANAGTAAISSLSGGNTVNFNFTRPDTEEDMEFYVPVPVMTSGTPKITIKLYADNNEVWTKSSTKTLAAIGRGGLLDMAALTIEDDGNSEWGLIGDAFGGWDKNRVTFKKIKSTNWIYAKGVTAVNGQFKFREGNDWDHGKAGFESEGYYVTVGTSTAFNSNVNNANIYAGNYDVYFNTSTHVGYFFNHPDSE